MNYNALPKDQLETLCKGKGFELPEGLSKEDMIALLEEKDKEEKSKKAEVAPSEKEEKPITKEMTEEIIPEENVEADMSLDAVEADDAGEADEDEDEYVPLTEEDVAAEQKKFEIGAQKKVRLRKRQKIYRNQRSDVLTIDGNAPDAYVSEEEKAHRELLHAIQDKNITLKGTVVSVSAPIRIQIAQDEWRTVVFAYVLYKHKKVAIPSFKFLPNESEIEDRDILIAMQRRIGTEVDFTVLQTDFTDGALINYMGSRLDAMRVKRREFWFGRKRQKGEIVYRINEDDVVEARILSVLPKALIVEVFGAETMIPADELAYEYVTDARDRFILGERVNVKITDIERDLSGESLNKANGTYSVKYHCSIKATMDDPRNTHFYEYEPDQTCRGTVTRVFTSNTSLRFIVNVAGEVDVYCWMKEGVKYLPEEGDSVSVHIARRYDDEHRLTGTITHVYAKRII